MALSRWQSSIVDQQGNIQPFAELVVLNEETQGAAAVFHDREGSIPISGNVIADENGYAYFYASAGRYRIQSVDLDIDWRDVNIGSAEVVQGTGSSTTNVMSQKAVTDNFAQLAGGSNADFTAMPEVGGSPIVSSGETNAGSWVQYADGTMIQRVEEALAAGNITSQYSRVYEWNFPKPFFDSAYTGITCPSSSESTSKDEMRDSLPFFGSFGGYPKTSSKCRIGVFSNRRLPSGSGTIYVGAIAIGRWKE